MQMKLILATFMAMPVVASAAAERNFRGQARSRRSGWMSA